MSQPDGDDLSEFTCSIYFSNVHIQLIESFQQLLKEKEPTKFTVYLIEGIEARLALIPSSLRGCCFLKRTNIYLNHFASLKLINSA